MSIDRIKLSGFRLHRETVLDLSPMTVLFGPNGAGKTSLFDALGYLHLAVTRDRDVASRRYGDIETNLSRNWPDGTGISLQLNKGDAAYLVTPVRMGKQVYWNEHAFLINGAAPVVLFGRNSDAVFFGVEGRLQTPPVAVRDSIRSAWDMYLSRQSQDVNGILLHEAIQNVRHFRCREFSFDALRQGVSKASADSTLNRSGENLWAVLRNLSGLSATERYADQIQHFLRRAFPGFKRFELKQVSDRLIAAEVLEDGWDDSYPVSTAPDGLLQMALNLTALFGEGDGEYTILLDEPDLSLHPWALFVLAEAIEDATRNWGRQVLLATHSPTLLSQFPEDSLYLMMPKDGATTIQKVSEIEDKKDLLAQYAVGSLYMMQMIGEQSPEAMVDVVETKP